MKIGVLGTGTVGQTIATALVNQKHLVRMGARSYNNEKAAEWVKNSNDHASQGDFNDAANFGEIIFLCLNGRHALDAIRSIEKASVQDKIIVDITNPLDFSKGMPPSILEGMGNNNSLGEEIQRILPGSHIVKVLNTVNCQVMVKPQMVNKGDHSLFLCGNNETAKNQVKHFLVDEFGWKGENLIDLGGIEASRGTEAFLPLWALIMQSLGTPHFGVKVVK